jgi:hypothetical protein
MAASWFRYVKDNVTEEGLLKQKHGGGKNGEHLRRLYTKENFNTIESIDRELLAIRKTQVKGRKAIEKKLMEIRNHLLMQPAKGAETHVIPGRGTPSRR